MVGTLLLALVLGQAAPSFQALFERGMSALGAGELDAAQAAFQQARELQPNNAVVYYQLGEVFSRRGELAEAISHFRKAIQLEPDEPEFYFRLALLQAQVRRFHDAQQILNELLRVRPRYSDAYLLLGHIASEQGDDASAVQHLGEYVRLRPDDPKGLGELGIALFREQNYQEGESLLRQALGKDPSLGTVHYNLGLLYNLQGHPDQAKQHLEVAAGLLPEKAEVYYQLGTALTRLNELAEAEKALRRALELSPENQEALYALGTLVRRLGRAEEAAQILAQHERLSTVALEERQRSRRISAYHMDVKGLLEQDRLAEAQQKLEEILRLDPRNDLAHYRLAQISFLERDDQRALESVRTALEQKDFEPAYHLLAAMCLERLGQEEQAIAAYERVLRLAEYAEAYLALGRLELRRGNINQAVAYLRQAVAQEPENPELHLALATALAEAGELEESQEERAKAKALGERAAPP